MSDTLHLVMPSATVTADADSRIIRGRVIPYGEPGYTNVGELRVNGPGRLRLPADPMALLYLMGHTQPGSEPPAAGYAVMYAESPDGLDAAFRVARTPLGDALLAEAVEGVRNGLSVELRNVRYESDGSLQSADVTAVAGVPIPAFASARTTSVVAAYHPHQEGPQPVSQPVQQAPQQQLQQLPTAQQLAAPATGPQVLAQHYVYPPAQPVQQVQQQPAQQVQQPPAVYFYGLPTQAAQPEVTAGQPFGPASAGLPFGMAHPAQNGGQEAASGTVTASAASPVVTAGMADVRGLAAGLAAVIRGEASPEIMAALGELPASAGVAATPDQWAGELWSGNPYTRHWVNLFSTGPGLTSFKVKGWRWVNRPTVSKYAGNLAAITGSNATMEPVEADAQRFAGGNTLDRKFSDFGDTEVLTSFLRLMSEAYAVTSDAYAREELLSFVKRTFGTIDGAGADTTPATRPAGFETVTQPTTVLRAAALSGAMLRETPNVRQNADFMVVNTLDWLDLMDVSQHDVPAFLAMLGVTPERFLPDITVPRGELVAGVRAALTWRELPGAAPIRVNAVNVVKGAFDEAVYGYAHAMLNRPGGIISVPFGATPAE